MSMDNDGMAICLPRRKDIILLGINPEGQSVEEKNAI